MACGEKGAMLRELINLFRSGEPLQAMCENFAKMLGLSLELVKKGGELFFAQSAEEEKRRAIQRQDVEVNKLERKIRKQVVVHLSVSSNAVDLPYCLVLMSLVKDVERIGDYAKDLAGLVDLAAAPLPEGELLQKLQALRQQIERDFGTACRVFNTCDREGAVALIRQGREALEGCEGLIRKIAHSSLEPGAAVKLALAARFYQRIAGHVLNLLSGVVMPLHRLDYYDEKDIEQATGRQ
jgi:phosphate uptake regulator